MTHQQYLVRQLIILIFAMGAALHSNKMQKFYFIIQKQLQFGRAIYVVGNIPQLGTWNVQNSLKLSWNKNNYWTGFIEVPMQELEQPLEYKFVIANWHNPDLGKIQWQAGKKNRIIEGPIKTEHLICENTWNMEKITLNLIVPDDGKNQQYYVTGDCKQLGNWKRSLKMKVQKPRNPQYFQNLKELGKGKNNIIYTLTFEIFREKSKFHYYYIKKTLQKNNTCQIERHPGRKYEIQKGVHSHPKCLKICHKKGDTEVFQICNFKELNYSQINENIFIGPYLKTQQDFQILKKEGVSSIISIQTCQDISMHCLTQDYLEEMCEKNNLELYPFAIQDMNKKDFLLKCLQPIQMLKKLVDENKKVYIHCTAGVYRSPQIVSLFLVLTQNLSPQQAIQYVKSRHPFARPSFQVIRNAIPLFSKNKKIKHV